MIYKITIHNTKNPFVFVEGTYFLQINPGSLEKPASCIRTYPFVNCYFI